MEENGKKKSGWKRAVLIALCVILALVLMTVVAGAIYANSLLKRINRTDPTQNSMMTPSEAEQWMQEELNKTTEDEEPTQDQAYPTLDANDVVWETTEPTEEPVEPGNDLVNILLIGQDRRPGESRARSDSMILCTFNKPKKTLTMTSFLRDMYVQIPGYKDNRINTAYAIGGMELLDATLEQNFGVHVDANVEVDFEEFKQIINLLGGVEIELTEKEANYLISKKNYNVHEGLNRLNGKYALGYARIRYIDNDFGRTNRQRKLLSSLIQAYKDQGLTKALAMLGDIMPLITTDMTDEQIIRYAKELFPLLASVEIQTEHIPIDGAYSYNEINGMNVVVPSLRKNREFIQSIMSTETETEPEE